MYYAQYMHVSEIHVHSVKSPNKLIGHFVDIISSTTFVLCREVSLVCRFIGTTERASKVSLVERFTIQSPTIRHSTVSCMHTNLCQESL